MVGYAGLAVVIPIMVEDAVALFTAISSAELHTYLDPNIHGTLKPRRGGSLAYLEEKISLWVYACKPRMEGWTLGAVIAGKHIGAKDDSELFDASVIGIAAVINQESSSCWALLWAKQDRRS